MEKIILGQMLTDNSVIQNTTLSEGDFLSAENKTIFKAILSCIEEGIVADIITVSNKLPKLTYKISLLTDNIGSAANYKYYEQEVKKASTVHKLKELADKIKTELNPTDPYAMLDTIGSELSSIEMNYIDSSSVPISELMKGFIDTLETRYNTKGAIPGIGTGLTGLDGKILGFRPKFLYYIGARPSDGKSALLLGMAMHAMLREKKKVGILSAESSTNEILTRAFAQEGCMNSMNLLTGMYSQRYFESIHRLVDLFHEHDSIICDEPNMSLQFLKREARRMVKVEKVEILFIDYVQLISNKEVEIVRDRVSETSMALKQLSRELNVPIVSAAQLRRDSENRKPTMADFADSSQIEKDADVAIMIYHSKESGSYLCVEKVRDGATGDVAVFFKREYVTFRQRQEGEM